MLESFERHTINAIKSSSSAVALAIVVVACIHASVELVYATLFTSNWKHSKNGLFNKNNNNKLIIIIYNKIMFVFNFPSHKSAFAIESQSSVAFSNLKSCAATVAILMIKRSIICNLKIHFFAQIYFRKRRNRHAISHILYLRMKAARCPLAW